MQSHWTNQLPTVCQALSQELEISQEHSRPCPQGPYILVREPDNNSKHIDTE